MTEPIVYSSDDGIARITLNRPDVRNAQNVALLQALDQAMGRAAADDEVKVIILCAAGDHFSAGHDIGTDERDIPDAFERIATQWWDHSDKSESESLDPGARRRRWAKRTILPRVPLPGLIRFFYMFILRGGFLDGWTGFYFCRFIATYDDFVALKLRALIRGQSIDPTGMNGISEITNSDSKPISPSRVEGAAKPHRQMQPEASPWTFREKVGRAIWMLVGRTVFRATFHNWYGVRRMILRMFGAKIGSNVAIRPTVHVEVPWMIHIEDGATVGDYAIIYSLGPIRIGPRSIISQYAHLCAGTHDYADHTSRLIRSPITIGADAWIGADAFVGPGVQIGALAVLGARSSAYKNLEGGRIHVGNPARDVKERNLK